MIPSRSKQLRLVILESILLGAPVFYCFYQSILRKTSFYLDITRHTERALLLFEKTSLPGHPLFHLLTKMMSPLIPGSFSKGMAAALILTFCVMAKYWIIRRQLQREVKPTTKWVLLAVATAVGLLFVFPFPHSLNVYDTYLGKPGPNLWHNPTFLTAMPFVMGAHVLIGTAINNQCRPRTIWICVLLLLGIAAKPIYAIPFLCVWPLFHLCYRKSLTNHLHWFFIWFIVIAICVLQYYWIYQGNTAAAAKSSIVIKPFAAWKQTSNNIPISFICGLCFPLLTLCLFPKIALKDKRWVLAGFIFLATLFATILFREEGPRKLAGNFGWFSKCGSFLIFYESARLLLTNTQLHAPKMRKMALALSTVFGLQILSGLIYFYGFTSKDMEFLGRPKTSAGFRSRN